MNPRSDTKSRFYTWVKPQTIVLNYLRIGTRDYDVEIVMLLSETNISISIIADETTFERDLLITEYNKLTQKKENWDLVGVSFRTLKTVKYVGEKDSFQEEFKIEYSLIPIFQYRNRITKVRKIFYGIEYHPYQRTDFDYDVNLILWTTLGLTNREITKWLNTTNFTIKKKMDLFLSNMNAYLIALRLNQDIILNKSKVNSNLINDYKAVDFINKLYKTKFNLDPKPDSFKDFFMIDLNNNFNLMSDPEFPNKYINKKGDAQRWTALNTLVKLYHDQDFRKELLSEYSQYFQFKFIEIESQVINDDT